MYEKSGYKREVSYIMKYVEDLAIRNIMFHLSCSGVRFNYRNKSIDIINMQSSAALSIECICSLGGTCSEGTISNCFLLHFHGAQSFTLCFENGGREYL